MSLYGLKYYHPDYFGTPGFWRWKRVMDKRDAYSRIVIGLGAGVLFALLIIFVRLR